MTKQQKGNKNKIGMFIVIAILLALFSAGGHQLWVAHAKTVADKQEALEEIEEIENNYFKNKEGYSESFSNEEEEIAEARSLIKELPNNEKDKWTKKIDEYEDAVKVATKMVKTTGADGLKNIDESYNTAKDIYDNSNKTTQKILKKQYTEITESYEFAKDKTMELSYLNYSSLYSKSLDELKAEQDKLGDLGYFNLFNYSNMLNSRIEGEETNSFDELDDFIRERALRINEEFGFTSEPTFEKNMFVGVYIEKDNTDPEIYAINFGNRLILGFNHGEVMCALLNTKTTANQVSIIDETMIKNGYMFTGFREPSEGSDRYWYNYYGLMEETSFLKGYEFYTTQSARMVDENFKFAED